MSISLFVRSYPKDFEWLKLSIESMKKNLSGVEEKVLVIPWKSELPTEIESFFDVVVESFLYEHLDGYVAQQFDKLDAYKYVKYNHILYSDSDCIYINPFDAKRMFNPHPVLGMTPYTELEGSDGHIWKSITENLLGFPVHYEFMRTFPIVHRKETLIDFANAYPDLYKKVTGRNISEFNLLGAFAYHNQHPYHFTENIPKYPCKQYWSWSGLTEQERNEIEGLMNAKENE